MQSYKSPQGWTGNNSENRHPSRNRDAEIWVRNGHDDGTYFTSDFDVSSCTTTAASLRHAGRREPSKRNERLFTAWIVRLNSDNRLIVEGSLECGRRARTKPIAERLSATKILSKFKHTYRLVGNMVDPQYELPGFVRHRFQAGFPEDWEIVVEIWKSFGTPSCNGGTSSSCISGGFIVEKKLKLAVDGWADSHSFVECARQVHRVDTQTHAKDREIGSENIENIRYHECSKESRATMNQSMKKSITDYESQDDQRSRTMNNVRQLTGWTPFVVPDETVKYSLVFRGTLLSSMGHAVSKNHVTDAVQRRLSARIIETVKQELYELIGDINNTKRDVPKELITWCRYGCPKQIHSFCEKWRILRSDETKFQEPSPRGEMKTSRDRGESPTNCRDKSAYLNNSSRTDPSSAMEFGREKKKRKRKPMELNDSCNISEYASTDNDTTCNEKLDAILMNNSRDRSWPKIRRKSRSPRFPFPQGGDLEPIEQVRPSVTRENKQQSSPLKRAPSLSYVYHRRAPSTDNILSDGV